MSRRLKIDRSDTDYNTVKWKDDYVSVARQSRTHVRISRHKHRLQEPFWNISLDVTSGYRMLQVADGNRLACVANRHLLAITCGEYVTGGSLHNYYLHYIHDEGRILWSRPWRTIQRFTMVNGKLLVLRYASPPNYWIIDAPLEAHLLEPKTGESVGRREISIPEKLKPHYQSWQVASLKTYLVWRDGRLLVTVRPYFRPSYTPAHALTNRGSFTNALTFENFRDK